MMEIIKLIMLTKKMCKNPKYKKSIEKCNTLSKLKFKCEKCGEEIKYDDVKKHADTCEANIINEGNKTNNGKIKRLKKLIPMEAQKSKRKGKISIYDM